jgi:hypothetical protein
MELEDAGSVQRDIFPGHAIDRELSDNLTVLFSNVMSI